MAQKYLIPLILLTLFLAACSDDDTAGPVPNPDLLLTIHVNDYFLEALADSGLVFVSDTDGNLLATTTWNGPGTITLENAVIHPDTISFTFVHYSDWELALATEVGIPAGTERTFDGYLRSELSGEAEIAFLNVPNSDHYRLAHNWAGGSRPGRLPASYRFEVFGDSTDCFVRIDPPDGPPVGGWIRGLQPGDSETLDLGVPGVIAPLAPATVLIPTGWDRLSASVSGTVLNGNVRSIISFDGQNFEGVEPNSVTTYLPEWDSAYLGTMFYMVINGSPGTYFTQKTTGPVPAAFTKLEGELTVTSTEPDNLTFTTTASWHRFSAILIQHHGLYVQWYVEGQAPIQSFALPQLPAVISQLFPDYPVEGFELDLLEIHQDTTEDMVRGQGKTY